MRWNESSVTEGMLAALGGVAPPQANILYLVFGCILGATNLIIFAAIMRHRALRNHKVGSSSSFLPLLFVEMKREGHAF